MAMYLTILYWVIGLIVFYVFLVVLAIFLFKLLELFGVGGVRRYILEKRVGFYLKRKYPGCRITRLTYDDYEGAFLTIIRHNGKIITRDYTLEKNKIFGKIIPKNE